MTDNSALQTLQYEATKKSVGVAYVLWFFLGLTGAHRFYLKRTGSAKVMLMVFVASCLLLLIGFGVFSIFALLIWCVIDLFLIPSYVSEYNLNLANILTSPRVDLKGLDKKPLNLLTDSGDWVCSECCHQNGDGDIECEACGEPRRPGSIMLGDKKRPDSEQYICSKCRSNVSYGDKFCKNCGEMLEYQ